jgi:hypothetical protein
LVTGCERKPELGDIDVYMYTLEKWSRRPWPDAKERINYAINKYKNKMMDPEPILIKAMLSDHMEPDEYNLYIAILDEDEDILGFFIREESKDPNGPITTLEEDYPVFAHFPGIGAAGMYEFDIVVRKGEQKKDKKAWDDFFLMDFDARVSQLKLPASIENWHEFENVKSTRILELWRSLKPTIFISLPDPENLNVSIYVYDKAGNESETIELEIYNE